MEISPLENLPICREQLQLEYPILFNIWDDWGDIEAANFLWIQTMDNHIIMLMYGNHFINVDDEEFD